MSEQKQQNRFVPLRVRFRSPAEQAQWEREHAAHITPSFPSTGDDEAQQALNMPLPEGVICRVATAHAADQRTDSPGQYSTLRAGPQ